MKSSGLRTRGGNVVTAKHSEKYPSWVIWRINSSNPVANTLTVAGVVKDDAIQGILGEEIVNKDEVSRGAGGLIPPEYAGGRSLFRLVRPENGSQGGLV
jgi:hypothetical protein